MNREMEPNPAATSLGPTADYQLERLRVLLHHIRSSDDPDHLNAMIRAEAETNSVILEAHLDARLRQAGTGWGVLMTLEGC